MYPAHPDRKGSDATIKVDVATKLGDESPKASLHSTYDGPCLKQTETTLTDDPGAPPVDPAPMTRARLLAVALTLALGSFLTMMDQSILGAALPAITNQFGELSSIAWISAAYMLTFTALQSIFSKVSEIIGRLPVLLVSLAVFIGGSAVCGAASSMTVLIAGRAVAGCGGCGVATMVQVILIDIIPLRRRATYMSYMSFTSTLAVVCGPLIGGAITDHWLWRWCFYLNIPLCAVIAAVCVFTLRLGTPTGTAREKFARIDFLGASLLLSGLVLVILGLNWGGKDYRWNSAAVIVTLVLGAVLLGVFAFVEKKYAREPIIPMRLFTDLPLAASLLSQLFLGAGITFTVLYLPVYFTVVHGASSTVAGLYMLPFLVGMSVTGLVVGPLVSRLDLYRPFVWVGLAAMTVAAALLNIVQPDTRLIVVLVLTGVFGVGSGVGMLPLMIATQATCQPRDAGTAATLALHMRNVGSIIGIAMVGTIFNNRLIDGLTALAAELPDSSAQIMGSINNATIVWGGSISAEVHTRIIACYVTALKATFIANAPFVGAAFLMSLLIKHRSLGRRAPPRDENKAQQPADNV
ncbi:hypothetical protein LPJ61_002689 [Coemansia biformis]|uniref:Major facilitator superfamily (MFS) profile domain-containing protein n=1 Tax=Coemansia biformis TaxID=1286918 RepID=A0A9W7YCM0_9FUNG|nr:hypothetical protein LPJ61_002689 [Coemansia biformis]